MGPDHGARRVRILGIRRAIVTERETLPPAEGAEIVIEGVVFHHQDDDVLDLRQHVGADLAGGIGPVARPDVARPPLPPTQLLAFNPLPGAHAGHVSPSSEKPRPTVRGRLASVPAGCPGQISVGANEMLHPCRLGQSSIGKSPPGRIVGLSLPTGSPTKRLMSYPKGLRDRPRPNGLRARFPRCGR